MQRDEWSKDKQALLAAEWKVKPSTVEQMASEASRRVVFLASLVTDPERLKADVSSVLMRSLHSAAEKGSHSDVARVGDIVTRIVGARAPERKDLRLEMSELEALSPPALLAKLRAQRARLDEAIAKLEAEHPELEARHEVNESSEGGKGPDVAVLPPGHSSGDPLRYAGMQVIADPNVPANILGYAIDTSSFAVDREPNAVRLADIKPPGEKGT